MAQLDALVKHLKDIDKKITNLLVQHDITQDIGTEFKACFLIVARQELFRSLTEPSSERAALVQIDFLPADGSFDYPGGSPDPGELPLDPIDEIAIYPKGQPGELMYLFSGMNLMMQQFLEPGFDLAAAIFGGDDTFRLSDERDVVSALGGNDTVFSRAGNDRLFGNAGDDRLVSSSLAGEHATLDGGAGKDTVSGGAGDDVVKGGKGADILSGGGGRDRVYGGAGNDILRGGEGADLLTGGRGADNFVFAATRLIPPTWDSGTGAEADTIADFTRGEDHLDLSMLFGAGVDAVFRGTKAFTGTGQVRVEAEAGGLLVQVNIDGDLAPEVEIHLAGLDDLARADLML